MRIYSIFSSKRILSCLALVLFSVGVIAQGHEQTDVADMANPEGSVHFGVVDWRYALFQSTAARDEDQKMQQANKELIERAQLLERDIDSQGKRLEKDAAIMGESELETLQRTFNQNLREYEEIRLRLQEIQTQTEARFLAEQRANVDLAIRRLAEKYNLDFVIERTAVVYAKQVRNITEELIEVLNEVQAQAASAITQ